ncbi:MAG: N utilization substance protein B [Firmicutes bacterium]|nr:N utilization substance protein B [Bacillota bacterium]
MDRKAQRDAAYKLIFEFVVTGNENPYGLEELSAGYITRVFAGIIERKDELNAVIDKYADGFEGRVFPADRAALLLATYEILYEDDIPSVVSINEAVELVNLYSTKKSPSYVNGILGKVIKSEK